MPSERSKSDFINTRFYVYVCYENNDKNKTKQKKNRKKEAEQAQKERVQPSLLYTFQFLLRF